MARQKLTHRLPQLRVSEWLHHQLMSVAAAQEMNLTEVMRAALEEYVKPPENVVPIVGVIKDGMVIFDTPPFKPVPGAKVLSRYLEVEPVRG
jgi:hypothetical protein